MDFSKLKLEVYDLLGVILPGLIAVCAGWISVTGWRPFTVSLNHLSAAAFTVLVVLAFAVGQLVQEFGDVCIKVLKGSRFSKSARDAFWVTEEADPVKAAIRNALEGEIAFVDTAFDYCLTELGNGFAKRDIFVATSDLCRSLAVLSVLGVVPVLRIAWFAGNPSAKHFIGVVLEVVFLMGLAALSWKRMVRFRELSETTVFRAYLATVGKSGRS